MFTLFLPLILWAVRQGRKDLSIKKTDSINISNENPYIQPSQKTLIKQLKGNVRRFATGLSRYLDIETSKIPSHTIRNFIYRNIFKINLAQKAIIYYGAEIRGHMNLTIGSGTIIGDKSVLDARNGITIGKNVNFSTGVEIWTEQHRHSDPWFRVNNDPAFGVHIGDRVWIGPRVTILHSVTIGEGAVIGAGSIVTKDVEPFTIVAGIPAKPIGKRNTDLRYEFTGKPLPFL